MSAPVITTITPNVGPTSGRALVEVYGDGFRLPSAAPNPTGPTPAAGPSVEVLFDDVPGTNVQVLRTNRLSALTPSTPIPTTVVRLSGAPTLTFAPGAPDTIVRSAGSWAADGFRAGQRIEIMGSTSNDGAREIATVAGATLELATAGVLVAEGPTAAVKVTSRAYGEGKVSVTVRNLDAAGIPIPGESVTVSDAYTFRRVQLAEESNLTRLVRELVRIFRSQVIPNVSVSTHTEFDAETGDVYSVTELAEVPGIALDGPDLSENRFYSLNGTITVVLPSGEIVVRRAPYTVDLEFSLTGVSNEKTELLNLMALTTQVVDRNPYVYMDRHPTDPSLGRVRYEFDFASGGALSMSRDLNVSNVRSFTGAVVIRGFDVEDLAGFVGELGVGFVAPVDAPTLEVAQTGETYEVGPSPGGGR